MKPKTRQTLIGVTGQVVVLGLGLNQGYDGLMVIGGVVAIGATVTPELADRVPIWSKT